MTTVSMGLNGESKRESDVTDFGKFAAKAYLLVTKRILSLSAGVILTGAALTMSLQAADEKTDPANAPQLSGKVRVDLPWTDAANGRKQLRYELDAAKITGGGIPEGDAVTAGKYVARNGNNEDYRNGVAGGDVVFKFAVPGTIEVITVSGSWGNYATSIEHKYSILYSLDGLTWKPAVEKMATGNDGLGDIKGEIKPDAAGDQVWIRYNFPNNDWIVLHKLAIALTVKPSVK